MIVTFCGHRTLENAEEVYKETVRVVEALICEGATQFYCGDMGAFDRLAARALRALKERYPQVRSTLVKAYLDQDMPQELYDDSVWPPLENTPPRLAIVMRNRWMADESDAVVAYVRHGWGGASNMRAYAVKKGKRVIDIAENLLQNNA